jgi:uncharacterized protein with FMN-binding domain
MAAAEAAGGGTSASKPSSDPAAAPEADRVSEPAPAAETPAPAIAAASPPATAASEAVPESTAPANPTPAVPPVPVESTPPVALPPAPPTGAPATADGALKDGTYLGWGKSRHGDIQASVVIENGRIAKAVIAQCLTRYTCDIIDHLQKQVVERQTPDVDVVGGATTSSDAFYWAVVSALDRAK